MIETLYIENYKIIKKSKLDFKPHINIFVGENDSGKSTILEALSIITSGRLHYIPFNRQITPSLFNFECRSQYISAIKNGDNPEPPVITIEAYWNKDGDARFRGKNNSLGIDAPGVRVTVEFDEAYSELYKSMLDEENIADIPVELYKVEFKSFNGEAFPFRISPVHSVLIDASHKDYSSTLNAFVNNSIEDILSPEDKVFLSREYSEQRNGFKDNSRLKELADNFSKNSDFDEREISIILKDINPEMWIRQMTLAVDQIPFENMGFGTQNIIKSELVLRNIDEASNIILIEEPENNLSYANMAKLINRIESTENKQIFIATHSSYVANKLALNNLFLLYNGVAKPFSGLSDEVIQYFKKLPGYNTLRVILANKVILVEGPTDELILQRAYKDRYRKLPIEDGIDIIVVESLAFKRYCEIAIALKKKIYIVTDNDGDKDKLQKKYKDYTDNPYVKIYYEPNEELHTIEPSVLNMNCHDGIPNQEFVNIVYQGNQTNFDFDSLGKFMQKNKTEWALRVFDAEDNICYPEYIEDVLQEVNQD
jgi:putative ATP-dependent endonuclease of OLD family